MTPSLLHKPPRWATARRFAVALLMIAGLLSAPWVQAQETVCARVKIEIKQKLTLERQAFDAEMKINNTTDTGVIENVGVVVKVTDEAGTPVAVTSDPNDLSAKFYLRVSKLQNILAVDGTGTVNAKTTSIINWLLIPSPGAAGTNPFGKKYLVGATLSYRFGGEDTVLTVSPDVVTVKPLPLLTLDYFLTQDVWADDPLTAEIEPVEPFTLGVRVKNTGHATAKDLKIDSAQPKIVENSQGLLINFILTGSFVNDAPAQNTLLINFGDIAANTSKMGRWNMETTLAGRFTEFTAKFSHADELGGALTSILQATNAHLLIRDVRVDLSGRDAVRDFLAQDGDFIRVYESDGPDTLVTDRSSVATFTAGTNSRGNASYRLSFPPTDGPIYIKLADPFNGSKALGQIMRSDGKQLLPENVWLSKTRDAGTLHYWVNFFDINSTGVYESEFQAAGGDPRPPVLQFIPDRVVQETRQVSFLVEASSPDHRPITLSAAPLPAGASFVQQAPDPLTPGLTRAIFDWTPVLGTAGNYLINYTATDGSLSATRSASIRVEAGTAPPGAGTPTLVAPLPGAQVTELKPALSVQTSTNPLDPTTHVQFELYSDEAMTALVGSTTVGRAALGSPTAWTVPSDLPDNTRFWWRARAFDGALYSAWANGHFFVNTFNDPPDSFNLSNPLPGAEVASVTPTLAWTNSLDKDGDAITYRVTVYRDVALTDIAAQSTDLAPDASGSTSWTVAVPDALTNHLTYYWRVVAKDALGAQTPTAARPFVVATSNSAPTAPVIVSPVVGGQSTAVNTVLTIQNSTDADGDLLTYVFEVDKVDTFDSSEKASSGQVIQSGGGNTSWTTTTLVENRRYWWRVKAQDGRTESAWVGGNFLMNAVNDAPPTPTVKNPGSGAWTADLQPSLQGNPVVDPDGDTVRYQFEIFSDAALSLKVGEGVSDIPALTPPTPLADKTTHWWRLRALDFQDLASAWSEPAVLYVSSGTYQDPTIAVTTPATPMKPDTVSTPAGPRQQVTIRWEGTDPNIDATVALYYGTSNSGFVGNLIVDGLRQNAGTQTGSYVWDVTGMASGAYYVYAVIYDAKGLGRAYAPGAVVVPPATQTGTVVTDRSKVTLYSGAGSQVSFYVKLGRAPTVNVVVPIVLSDARRASVSPPSLVFTPSNWSTLQRVNLIDVDDCLPGPSSVFQAVAGGAQTYDPNFVGVVSSPVAVTYVDYDKPGSTDRPDMIICIRKIGTKMHSQQPLDVEYTFSIRLINLGSPVGGVTATRVTSNGPNPSFEFGAVGTGETVSQTWTYRSGSFMWQGFETNPWNVTVR